VEWTLHPDGRAEARVERPTLFIDFDVTSWTQEGGYGQMLQRAYPAPLP
jgi:hypothetical protein